MELLFNFFSLLFSYRYGSPCFIRHAYCSRTDARMIFALFKEAPLFNFNTFRKHGSLLLVALVFLFGCQSNLEPDVLDSTFSEEDESEFTAPDNEDGVELFSTAFMELIAKGDYEDLEIEIEPDDDDQSLVLFASLDRHLEERIVFPYNPKEAIQPLVYENPPEECSTPIQENLYVIGRAWKTILIKAMWVSVNDCNEEDPFVERVLRIVKIFERLQALINHPKIGCLLSGIVDGAYWAVGDLQDYCVEKCSEMGREKAAALADHYCETVIFTSGQIDTVPWDRGDINNCGFSYEMECDAAFMETTALNEECEPYTQGESEDMWYAFLEKACDFTNRDSE